MMNPFETMVYRRRLRIGCFDFDDEELGSGRPRLRRLLGAIVYQAMHDGMLKLRMGVDRERGTPWMKYFGPVECEERIWWDMVPPPVECYPAMLQVCVSLAELEAQVPIKGVIPAVKGWERLKLDLNMEEIHSFEIAWDTRYAIVRRRESDGVAALTLPDKR